MKLRSIGLPSQSIPGKFALAGLLALILALAPASILLPTASAACPDAELVFARGRQESPGAGVVGNALISALRSRVNKNISLYAVRYPADTEVDVGANDMSAHVQSTINGCPNTRVVLGGYSLGAAVTDVVVAAPDRGIRLQQSPAAGRRSAHRGRRTVRQRHPVGRADHEFQPDLRRPDHRQVPRRRPDLQPG